MNKEINTQNTGWCKGRRPVGQEGIDHNCTWRTEPSLWSNLSSVCKVTQNIIQLSFQEGTVWLRLEHEGNKVLPLLSPFMISWLSHVKQKVNVKAEARPLSLVICLRLCPRCSDVIGLTNVAWFSWCFWILMFFFSWDLIQIPWKSHFQVYNSVFFLFFFCIFTKWCNSHH